MNKICNNCGTSTDVCKITGEIVAYNQSIYNVKSTYLSEKGIVACMISIMKSFKVLSGEYGNSLRYDIKCETCDEKLHAGTFTPAEM